MMRLKLYDIAHSRAGDKGQLITLSVIPYDRAWYPVLREQLEPDRVRDHLRDRLVGAVERFEMRKLAALMFVGCRANGDSVTTSLHVDGHGKTMSSALLEMEIDVPDDMAGGLDLASNPSTASGAAR